MSLKEIAKSLGLSITTVSRALNGYDDVAEETRQRVQAEVERSGYRPNAMARRLKMGKIDAIGLVCPVSSLQHDNGILLEMVTAISHELACKEIDLLLIADESDTGSGNLKRLLQGRRVDAFIVAHTLPKDPRLQLLQQHDFPFIALGRSELARPYAWFDFDNYQGIQMATNHLIALGHKRIALLKEDSPQAYVSQRHHGYLEAMAAAGLEVLAGDVITARNSRLFGYRATKTLCAARSRPTAIVTTTNMLGDGAAQALHELGYLGGEISLIVYDGLPADSLITTDVSAIIQATRREVGQQIATMALELLNGRPVSELQVLWQPQLRLGATTSAVV
ncbi:MAG: LacI family DNA-binding transcriptional regulator [Aeromonadaceae bacterium]